MYTRRYTEYASPGRKIAVRRSRRIGPWTRILVRDTTDTRSAGRTRGTAMSHYGSPPDPQQPDPQQPGASGEQPNPHRAPSTPTPYGAPAPPKPVFAFGGYASWISRVVAFLIDGFLGALAGFPIWI